MPRQRCRRIAIERSADRLREIDEIDRLGVQHAVAVGEMMHRQLELRQLRSQSRKICRVPAASAAG